MACCVWNRPLIQASGPPRQPNLHCLAPDIHRCTMCAKPSCNFQSLIRQTMATPPFRPWPAHILPDLPNLIYPNHWAPSVTVHHCFSNCKPATSGYGFCGIYEMAPTPEWAADICNWVMSCARRLNQAWGHKTSRGSQVRSIFSPTVVCSNPAQLRHIYIYIIIFQFWGAPVPC